MPADAVEDGDPLEHIGPYRVIERIGSGAMGHVYRAEHTLLGRMVAIKMLRPELASDEACVRRFLAEARAVNLIKHEHIIDVTDFACTPGGQPWFVMELLEGSDLAQAASREPLSLERTLEITRQLCEALAAVHTAGIVHRDVKPENVFLQQRDGRDYVTLLDFGIARLPDPTSPDPLQEGLMGTPHYMAPEQISASPIDHRADLYAVGSVLFELVAGMTNTPFRAVTLQRQLMDVMMQPAPRLSARASVPEVIRDRLDALVERCLAKQPSDRPASAREVAEELSAIAAELEASVLAESERPTLMLRACDGPRASQRASSAPRASQPGAALVPEEVLERRRRARRALRSRRVWSSRGATLLSAAAAAAAMWVATSETSWAHAFSRVTSWGAAADAGSFQASAPVHVVEPSSAAVSDSRANAHIALPVGGVGSLSPLLTATTHAEVERASARARVSGEPSATARAERVVSEEPRGARREAPAKARGERSASSPADADKADKSAAAALVAASKREIAAASAPQVVILPAEEPAGAAEPAYAPPAPVVDRDLVLNPFE